MTELFIATGDAVAKVVPEGQRWKVQLALTGSGAQCIAVDGRDINSIYVGTYGKGIWKSADGGIGWRKLELPQSDIFSVAVSPVDGSVYAGCEPSMLFRSDNGGDTWYELSALRSLPSAPTWSFPPRPWTSHVRWIAPSPHDAHVLLAGIELGGLMYSNDGGKAWKDHRPGAQRDVHAIAWHPRVRGRAYEAGGGGAAWSSDGGLTWKPADTGRDRHYTWALAVDADDPECWYVSASPGPMHAHSDGNAEAYIYRWRGNGPWLPLGGGIPTPLDSMPYALACASDGIYAGLSDGRIYFSQNAGGTWHILNLKGDALPSVLALAVAE